MRRTIPERESLTVEFKSDLKRLPDGELVATVVCLANTEGGTIYLGVEDDGRVTGLHPEHQNVSALSALIANRTNPPLSVRVSTIVDAGLTIAHIEVPRSTRLVATSDGLLQRRRLQADGTPQYVPFYPHEFVSRQSDLDMLDCAALSVVDATEADFDLIQQEQMVLQSIETRGSITQKDAVAREPQASYLLRHLLVDKGVLLRVGERKGTVYERGPTI